MLENNKVFKLNTIDNKNVVDFFNKSKNLNDFKDFFECCDNMHLNSKFEFRGRFGHCLGHILSSCLSRNLSFINNLSLKVKIINYLLNFDFDLNCMVDSNNFEGVSVFSALMQFVLLTQETNCEEELIKLQINLKEKAENNEINIVNFLDYQTFLVKSSAIYPDVFISTNYHMFIYSNIVSGIVNDIKSYVLGSIHNVIGDIEYNIDNIKEDEIEQNYSVFLASKKRLIRETIFIGKIFVDNETDTNFENKKIASKSYARRVFFNDVLSENNNNWILSYLTFWEKAIKLEDKIHSRIVIKKHLKANNRQNIRGIALNTLLQVLNSEERFNKDILDKTQHLLTLLKKEEKELLSSDDLNVLNKKLEHKSISLNFNINKNNNNEKKLL